MKRKTVRVRQFVDSHARKQVFAIISWCAESIDYSWMRMQWLDSRGRLGRFAVQGQQPLRLRAAGAHARHPTARER
eukprot:4090874-Prorocentrum_lima.AAC.1